MGDTIDDRTGDGSDAGHPIPYLLSRYARPYRAGILGGLGALLLARIPERVLTLVVGVGGLDMVLFANTEFGVPFVPPELLPDTALGQVWLLAAVLLVAAGAEAALDWVADHVYGRATLAALHDVRTASYDAVMGLRMEYFDENQTGDVMSVLNNDVNNLQDLAQGTRQGVEFGAKVVVALAFMLALHWELALVVASMPVVLAVTSRVYANALEPRYDAVRERVGRVNSRLEDAVGGITTVKAAAREGSERERVGEASAAYKSRKWDAIRLRLAYDASTWTIYGVGNRALLLLGGYWILAGPPLFFSRPLTPGLLLTFFMYSRSFLFPIRRLAVEVIERYENAHASAKRVQSVLTHPATLEADPDAPALAVDDGRVEYDDVSFSYAGAEERTLSGIDLSVEGGEFVGIVGATGAGKSTLLKLLFRFYDPDEGRIAVDGQDTREVGIRSLRESIGYVSQDPFLFYGTVRENVAYGDPDVADDEVVAAAKLAGAHEFVTDLPAGYDTEVGERGVKLSGGQRQRVAIARAIIRDPPILVLDEATSHVDNETELQIQQSLASLASDRTTFVVAHRLSTVRDADRVVVLDDGRIVESGTHEELLEREGTYADLWRVQVGDLDGVSEAFLAEASAAGEVPE